MYHKGFSNKRWTVAAIVAAMVGLWAAQAHAQGDPLKCSRTLVKEASKLEQKRAKALRKCNDANLKAAAKGEATVVCPDGDSQGKITAAEGKLTDKVTDACGGVALADISFAGLANRCVGGSADGALCYGDSDCLMGACTPSDRCPSLYNGNLGPVGPACDFPLVTPADLANCVICIGQNAVDTVIGATYPQLGSPLPASIAEPGDTLKCQRTIGKEIVKYYAKRRKALAKCEDGVLKGGSGPCPDGDSAGKIADALAKFEAKVGGSCSPFGSNLENALDNQPLCPTGVVSDSDNFAGTLQCITDQVTSCASLASTGDTTGCQPLCGNGRVDAGETCDDSNYVNGDGCPNDCTIADCTPSGATVDGLISVTVPGGTSVVVARVYVQYPDDKVRIPGLANAQLVFDNYSPTDSGAGLDLNDLNYAISILENTDGTVGLTGLPAFGTINFDTCDLAPAPVDGDFVCLVLEAFDISGDPIFGASCTVDVP